MQVKTVSAHFEGTVNLGNYQNVKLGATVEVALDDGDTMQSASEQARALAREQVAQELAAMIEREVSKGRVHYTGDASLRTARQKVAGMADGGTFYYLEMIAPDVAAAIVAPVHERLMELEKAYLEEQERQRQEAAARGDAEPEGDDELDDDEEEEDDNNVW